MIPKKKFTWTAPDTSKGPYKDWYGSWHAILGELTTCSQRTLDDGAKTFRDLLNAKTAEEAFRIQASYASRAYQDYMEQLTKVSELYGKLVTEVHQSGTEIQPSRSASFKKRQIPTTRQHHLGANVREGTADNPVSARVSDKRKCFVSFSRDTRPLALAICNALREEDYVTNDGSSQSGELWIDEASKFIRNSDAIVVIVSSDALSSRFARDEWALIQEALWQSPHIQVLPVLVGEVVGPAFLQSWQALKVKDVSTHQYATSLARNLATLIKGREGEAGGAPNSMNTAENSNARSERFREFLDCLAVDVPEKRP